MSNGRTLTAPAVKPQMARRIFCAKEMLDDCEILRPRKTGKKHAIADQVNKEVSGKCTDKNGKETARPGPVFVGNLPDLPFQCETSSIERFMHHSWVQSIQVSYCVKLFAENHEWMAQRCKAWH